MERGERVASPAKAPLMGCSFCDYQCSEFGHLSCCHPDVVTFKESPKAELIRYQKIPHIVIVTVGEVSVEMIREGWHSGEGQWPFSFKPHWLLSCTGFSKKEK